MDDVQDAQAAESDAKWASEVEDPISAADGTSLVATDEMAVNTSSLLLKTQCPHHHQKAHGSNPRNVPGAEASLWSCQ